MEAQGESEEKSLTETLCLGSDANVASILPGKTNEEDSANFVAGQHQITPNIENMENSVLDKTVVPSVQKNDMNEAVTNVISDCGDSQNIPTPDSANAIFLKIDRKNRKRRKDKIQSDGESDQIADLKKIEATLHELRKELDEVKKENAFLKQKLAARETQPVMAKAPSTESIEMIADDIAEEASNIINNSTWSAEVAENLGTAVEGRHVAQPATLEDTMNNATPNMASTGAIRKKKKNDQDPKMTQATTTEGKRGNRTAGSKGKGSPPIIKIYNVNVKIFRGKLKEILGHELFNIRLVNSNLIELKLVKVEDHAKVRSFLESQQLPHYTYTLKDAKPYTLMVKGLSETYDENDLRSFISEKQKDLVLKSVTKLEGDRWIVQLDGNSDVQSFRRMQYLLNNRVEIDSHKREGVVQCRNCQRFGHVSTNCRMEYRCVKCGKSHGPKKCNIPGRDDNTEEIVTTDPITGQVVKSVGKQVHCINCKKDGHVASAKNCPKRLEILKKLNEKKKNAKSAATTLQMTTNSEVHKTAPIIGNNISYSGVARMATRAPAATTPRDTGIMEQANRAMGKFDEECKRLLGKNFMSCMTKIGEFATTYNTLQTDEERSQALFGLFISLKLND